MSHYVTHLECANCCERYAADVVHGLCVKCRRPLWVRYDLERIRRRFSKLELQRRPQNLWRYQELLPVADPGAIVSLGETMTPIVNVPRLAAMFGLRDLFVKDESRLPTGSFKARGMAMAITKAKEFGIERVAVPTAGNAGGAMAAYAARAGIEAYVFMPQDTPLINAKECWLAGAKTYYVNGLIDDCGKIVGEGKAKAGWFDPRRSRSRTGSRARRRWGWSLPSSSAGICRT
jgi:threonine synthase